MYCQADKMTLTFWLKDNVNIPEDSSPIFMGRACNCLINKDVYNQAGLEEMIQEERLKIYRINKSPIYE